jgi:hypothetical protein
LEKTCNSQGFLLWEGFVLPVPANRLPFLAQTVDEKACRSRQNIAVCREREPTTFCVGVRSSTSGIDSWLVT